MAMSMARCIHQICDCDKSKKKNNNSTESESKTTDTLAEESSPLVVPSVSTLISSLNPTPKLLLGRKPGLTGEEAFKMMEYIRYCPSFTNISQTNPNQLNINNNGTDEYPDDIFTMKIGDEIYINAFNVYKIIYLKLYPFLISNNNFITNNNIRDAMWDMILSMMKDRKQLPEMSFIGVALIDSCKQIAGINKFFGLILDYDNITKNEHMEHSLRQRNYFKNCINFHYWIKHFVSKYAMVVMDFQSLREDRRNGKYLLYCSYCDKSENEQIPRFQVCIKCKQIEGRTVPYCSRKCQKLHWPAHKLECGGRQHHDIREYARVCATLGPKQRINR